MGTNKPPIPESRDFAKPFVINLIALPSFSFVYLGVSFTLFYGLENLMAADLKETNNESHVCWFCRLFMHARINNTVSIVSISLYVSLTNASTLIKYNKM